MDESGGKRGTRWTDETRVAYNMGTTMQQSNYEEESTECARRRVCSSGMVVEEPGHAMSDKEQAGLPHRRSAAWSCHKEIPDHGRQWGVMRGVTP